MGKTENRTWGSGIFKLEKIYSVRKTTPNSVLKNWRLASKNYRRPVVRIVARNPFVFHMFWSFSALSLFVDFHIKQVPNHSETGSHIFLSAEQLCRWSALAAELVNVFNCTGTLSRRPCRKLHFSSASGVLV